MRALLVFTAISAAAIALPAAPLQAGDSDDRPRVGMVWGGSGFQVDFDRRDRRRLRGTDTILVYDREYQGDSAWRPESFNDWWHERPNRSLPGWVMRNRDCQRMWWDGSVLRC